MIMDMATGTSVWKTKKMTKTKTKTMMEIRAKRKVERRWMRLRMIR